MYTNAPITIIVESLWALLVRVLILRQESTWKTI